MKAIFLFLIMSVSTYPAIVYSFPNDHDHKVPDNFRVSCKTWGFDKEPSNADIIWDSKSKKMIITGGSIKDDNNSLIEGKGYRSNRTIHVASTFLEGQVFKFDDRTITRPDIKTLYMTFRQDHEPRHDAYHGGKWATIRAFEFQIRKGELGWVNATEISEVEGVLVIGQKGLLGDCSYSGIYAMK